MALKGQVAKCIALEHPVTSRETAQAPAEKIDTVCDRLGLNGLIREKRRSLAAILGAYAALGNLRPPVNLETNMEWFNNSSEHFRRVRAASEYRGIESMMPITR